MQEFKALDYYVGIVLCSVLLLLQLQLLPHTKAKEILFRDALDLPRA
jgi:hypothetical protein